MLLSRRCANATLEQRRTKNKNTRHEKEKRVKNTDALPMHLRVADEQRGVRVVIKSGDSCSAVPVWSREVEGVTQLKNGLGGEREG